jgi:hypothetical protein
MIFHKVYKQQNELRAKMGELEWLESTPQKFWNAFTSTETKILTGVGTSTAIVAIALLLKVLHLAPPMVILSIFYYTGLPTIFLVFLFQREGENKAFKWDKLAIAAYFVLAFVLLVLENTPSNWSGLWLLGAAYLIGVATSVTAGMLYVIFYEIDKPTNFKLRMIAGFSLTACVMIFVYVLISNFKLLAFLGA